MLYPLKSKHITQFDRGSLFGVHIMFRTVTLYIRCFFIFAFLSISSTQSFAFPPNVNEDFIPASPLRLSYTNGNVSFWRYGAPDWVSAPVNMPLTIGDSLYTYSDAEFELQLDNRSYVRADDNTQLTLVNQTPDFLQIKVESPLMQ